MENIKAADNGVINVLWLMQKGGPCWYCQGKPDCPCRSCEGTGVAGFRSAMYSGACKPAYEVFSSLKCMVS